MLTHIFLHRLLDTGGNKEILLFQTKLLACVMVIVGIEDLADISCKVFLLHRHPVIALVKGIQREALYRLRVPDP